MDQLHVKELFIGLNVIFGVYMWLIVSGLFFMEK